MAATHPPGTRVRWLVVGAFHPSPTGRRFLLTPDGFEAQLASAARGLRVSVPDRFGTGDASTHEVSFDRLGDFQLSPVIDAIPALRLLRHLHEVLAGTRAPTPELSALFEALKGPGRLSAAIAEGLRGLGSAQQARRVTLELLEEALFATARDILQHPVVARLESAWRGLHWLWTHCPPSSGLDLEVLDVGPREHLEALTRALDVPPLQRPDACFLLDASEDVGALSRLAALGEQASVPIVVTEREDRAPEVWSRLRADEASRWLGAALNPVVVMAERQGDVRRECFTSPALAVAALLAASFRDTHTFARVVGPGSGTRAPATWQPPSRSFVATQVGLSLHEQQRLAARGVLGVGGFWDTDTVQLAAAPTVYGGRDATLLPAQLLTGRLVRLAQELAERLPSGASQDAVASAFTRAAEAFLPTGPGRTCQLQGRVVSAGPGARDVHVIASLRPELAGTHLQLEFTLPLRG